MKNIALLHFAYPPNTGGVEVLVKEHAFVLSKLGYNVSIFTGAGQESNPAIKLTIIPEMQSILSFNPVLQSKLLEQGVIDEDFEKLVALLEDKLTRVLIDQDVIIVHNMLTIVRNLAFVKAFKQYVAKNPTKKYIAWTHDHSYINAFKIKDLDVVAKTQEERTLLTSLIDKVQYIAISETFKKPLVELFKTTPDKIEVIPNGINIIRFLEIDKTIEEVIDSYHLLNSFPVILSPVNILGRKNIEFSLEIIAAMKESYPNSMLIITGSTSKHRSTVEYLAKLKTKIVELNLKENVLFISEHVDRYLEESEIHDLYDLSDAVFYFSKSENFGLPLLEAALSKTPIFVSDLEVFREIGADTIHYIDYKTVNPKEAAQQIKVYLEKNNLVKAHHKIRTQYNLESILKKKLLPLLEK